MEKNDIVLKRIFGETGLTFWSNEYINWSTISCKPLSENFIREFQNKVDWEYVCTCQKLSEDFIREFEDKVDWGFISEYQNLSKDFINEFKDKVWWNCISKYQKLSEDFMKDFKDKLNWDCISKYQKLSEDFIREFKDYVNWENIQDYQKISKEFKKDFNIEIGSNNWLYKDVEFKKNKIIESGLYECHDDYFIGYKNIRKDRYSHFNFQYQYLKGETYECHCDTTEAENSFGLSAWTEEQAKQYNNTGIIVKVKIKYEDVGRVVHKGGKIRCFKFEVLD